MKAVKKSEFADFLGISRPRISQYLAEGILRKCLLPDGRLDFEMAKREIRDNVDPVKRMDYEARYDVQEKNVKVPDLGIDFSAYTKRKKGR